MNDNLKTVLQYVTQEEDKYYDLTSKSLDKGNVFGNQMMLAQATAFQRVRYFIEDILENENV